MSTAMPSEAAPQSNLRHVMPTAGMRYLSQRRLMYSPHHEACVADALGAVGCQMSSSSVGLAFAQMFVIASPFVSAAHAQSQSLWDTLPWVQHELNWAERLSQATFFELFICLVKARHDGLNNPDPSAGQVSGHDVLVHEIDAFRRAVGDCPKEGQDGGDSPTSWILTYATSYYQLVGGAGLEMEEYEDTEMGGADDPQGGNSDEYTPYAEPSDEGVASVILSMRGMGIQSRSNGS
ncbi:hypothetical protein F4861DRAFT_518315 [Xylaria intraflava]|nr:hypothetical protein F4861DRAFT_518315 [Xylaria intraflava]